LKKGKLDNENVETPLNFTRLLHKVTLLWQWKASWCWKRGSLLHGNGKRPDAGSVGAFLVVVVVEVEVVEVEVVAFHEESIFEESFHSQYTREPP
jgi:hypothetical protein